MELPSLSQMSITAYSDKDKLAFLQSYLMDDDDSHFFVKYENDVVMIGDRLQMLNNYYDALIQYKNKIKMTVTFVTNLLKGLPDFVACDYKVIMQDFEAQKRNSSVLSDANATEVTKTSYEMSVLESIPRFIPDIGMDLFDIMPFQRKVDDINRQLTLKILTLENVAKEYNTQRNADLYDSITKITQSLGTCEPYDGNDGKVNFAAPINFVVLPNKKQQDELFEYMDDIVNRQWTKKGDMSQLLSQLKMNEFTDQSTFKTTVSKHDTKRGAVHAHRKAVVAVAKNARAEKKRKMEEAMRQLSSD